MALPQVHRLRDRRAFDLLYRQGKRARGEWLTVWVLPQPGRAEKPKPAIDPTPEEASQGDGAIARPIAPRPSQIGVSISKKVDKRSVVRNRQRRRIHAAMVQVRSHLQPGLWILVAMRPQPASASCQYAEILQELEGLLKKVGAIDEQC